MSDGEGFRFIVQVGPWQWRCVECGRDVPEDMLEVHDDNEASIVDRYERQVDLRQERAHDYDS